MSVPYVFAIDKNFIIPWKVLLSSLKETSSLDPGEKVYVLHDSSIGDLEKQDLKLFAASYSVDIVFIDISQELSLLPPLRNGSHVTQLAFARLYIASVLPPTVPSAIYIDADTIAVDQISYLRELQLFKPIAACDHCSPFNQFRIHGEKGGSYFQSGLLRIDLDGWRRKNIEVEFSRVIENSYERLLWWDQDVLNIVFKDNWQRLPVSYNACRDVRESLENPQYTVKLEPMIVHFDGRNKPWIIHRDDDYGALWYSAYKRTFGSVCPVLLQKPSYTKYFKTILRNIYAIYLRVVFGYRSFVKFFRAFF